jgi:dinuclear metal center YbgI/SA1388 family protein
VHRFAAWQKSGLTNMQHVSIQALLGQLDQWLVPAAWKDYGPNGLQVEGKGQVGHLVTGVTASLALIEAAIDLQADAILVHHGLFWRGQSGCITGWMKQRLARLLAANINLLAYHLPLDAHPHWGNNAQLARVLGLTPLVQEPNRFGEQQLGWLGTTNCQTVGDLVTLAQQRLGRSVVCVGNAQQPIDRVAWCTGGAQSYFEPAIAAGANVFITGEISEPQAHYAREMGVAYLACGHHATERYGVQAVGAELAHHLGICHTFVDIDNPA